MTRVQILPIEEIHIDGYHACLDRVARERRYLAFTEAPPLEGTREFALGNIKLGNPHFVAMNMDKVVGWCDIERSPRAVFSHIGGLGMGLDAEHRGKGIGETLIRSALAKAREVGMEKVELGVLESNQRAIRLYEKVGFQIEGSLAKKFKIDGRYEALVLMGMFL